MACHCSRTREPLYLVEHAGTRCGPRFVETDRDSNSRRSVIEQIRTKEIDPICILAIDEIEGTCIDVTEDLVAEAMDGPDTMPLSPSERLAALHDHARDLRKHEVR
jgi:hypothetical protein